VLFDDIGLSAAKLLHENGIDVLVLEASERVGGRLYTLQVAYVRPSLSIISYATPEKCVVSASHKQEI